MSSFDLILFLLSGLRRWKRVTEPCKGDLWIKYIAIYLNFPMVYICYLTTLGNKYHIVEQQFLQILIWQQRQLFH